MTVSVADSGQSELRHADLVADLGALVSPQQVLSDDENQRPFECDGLAVYKQMPWVTVIPDTLSQVQAIMAYCYKHQMPVVIRGAGTGLCAGAMPSAYGVLLVMTRFSEILELDAELAQARVQPGVRNLALSDAAAHLGLYYAPDPSSQIACTIGGNVAENSGGVHCLSMASR